jgi:DNA repair exonuclease SbcCD nuclease subunit
MEMAEELKFTVYADIHYDELVSRCVTLKDIEEVERNILQRAIHNNHDFVLFAGDRFQHREPKDEVKTVADKVYKEFSYNAVARNMNIFDFILLGNHDWTDNSFDWYTYMSVNDLPKLQLMDSPCTYLGNKDSFRIHALPSGYKFDMNYFQTDPKCLNIFVFHDMLVGSYRSDEKESWNVFESGIPISDIDRPEFDAVFAGDIHIPQRFP